MTARAVPVGLIAAPTGRGRPRRSLYHPPALICATPGCGMRLTAHNRAGTRGTFCRPHANQLARIRDQLDTAPREYRIWGTSYGETE